MTDKHIARIPITKQSKIFFLVILGITLYLAWTLFQPFITFIIAGIFLAALSQPIFKIYKATLRKRKRIAAIVTIFTILVILVAPLTLISFALFDDVENAIQAIEEGRIEDMINSGLNYLPEFRNQTSEERNATVEEIWDDFKPGIENILQSILNRAVGFIADLAIALVIILFVVYYLLIDNDRIRHFLSAVTPLPPAQVNFMLHEAHTSLKAVFYGQILTSIIQGGLGGIGFLIAGVEGAVLWAAVMAVLSLLPVVGAFLVWVPVTIVLFTEGQLWQAVFLGIWGVLIVSQVDNFIRPKLIGNRAHIHPLLVLLGVLGGISVFGFIGLFLGPLIIGIAQAMLRVWQADYLEGPKPLNIQEEQE